MKKPVFRILVSGVLLFSLFLAGCVNQSVEATPSVETTPTEVTTAEKIPVPTETTPIGPIEVEYEYVKALLENNELTITLLSNEVGVMYLDFYGIVQYDEPYPVSGLKSTYTDVYIGTIGQDLWPYVFLLTSEGTVECVPIASQISAAFSKGDKEVSFESIGVLPEVENAVSFSEENVQEGDSGYVSVFAKEADGTTHNLSESLSFVEKPASAPARVEDSLQVLKAYLEEEEPEQAKNGDPVYTGEYAYVWTVDEYGRVFAVGTEAQKEARYCVTASREIYTYDGSMYSWAPVNRLAEIGEEASFWDIFLVITDPSEPLYEEYRNTAEIIDTPVVGQNPIKNPILLVPLKPEIELRVEVMADMSGYATAQSEETLFDGIVQYKTPYLINAELSKEGSVLRISASWFNGADYSIAVWFATYYEGNAVFTQYVPEFTTADDVWY